MFLITHLFCLHTGSLSMYSVQEEFAKWRQLSRHYKTHEDDKPHRCTKCDETFNMEEVS